MRPFIRIATLDDSEGVRAIYAPIVGDTVISFELEPPTVDEMRERIVATLDQYPWVVCEDEGRVAGYAYASQHRNRAAYQWAADVSIYVSEQDRGKGAGRALYTALLPILALQGYRQACGGIALPNDASVGLHETMGFRPIGVYRAIGYKFGAWHDVSWWQATLNGGDGPPEVPMPLPSVVGGTEVRETLEQASALLR